ncbi:unnamed protein product [Rhizophagus irregularis]|nr:unnamed protein product [Rhizophagus irregularis]
MEPSETNSISRDQSETFNTKDYQYASQKASSICCESDIYYPEGKDSQAYVWNISQLWISSKQQGDSQPKSKMLIDSKDLEKHDDFYEPIAEFGDSLEEVESRLKSNKQIDRVVWTAEYDGVKYQALPDYDVEAAERAQRAERARKTKTKGVKNKYLKNKKK